MAEIPPLLPDKTSYEAIEIPKFESTIPPTLLDKVPEEMKWIMNSLSKLTQAVDWLCRILTEEDKQLRETDTRAIGNRIMVETLKRRQSELEQRVQNLEQRFGENEKAVGNFKFLLILVRSKWFIITVMVLLAISAFIGAAFIGSSVGASTVLKVIVKLFTF
jgi:hypothetical protein